MENRNNKECENINLNLADFYEPGGNVYWEENGYGAKIIAGFDDCPYTGIKIAIEKTTSLNKKEARNAFNNLEEYSKLHPSFPYASGEILSEVLRKVNEKVKRWERLTQKEQEEIVFGFIKFQTKK